VLAAGAYSMLVSRHWKVKVPLRVKGFMWLAFQGSILTKDNSIHRAGPVMRGVGSVFQCGIGRFVWDVVLTALNCPVMPSKMDEVCDSLLKFKDMKVRQVVAVGVVTVILGI
jgi:hypothetical protein